MSLFLNSMINNNDLMFSVGYSENKDKTDLDLYQIAKYRRNITTYDKSLVVTKQRWQAGIIANEYPNSSAHYIADDARVYLCLGNNNGAVSTEKPTSRSLFNVKTSDGYVWRYLFDIESDDLANYIRIPRSSKTYTMQGVIASLDNQPDPLIVYDVKPTIKVLTANGSNAVFDFDYTNNKVNNVTVTSGGNGYSQNDVIVISDNFDGSGCEIDFDIVDGEIVINSFTPGGNYASAKVFVVGDGLHAEISATVANGSISNITVDVAGSGYTWAKLIVVSSENSDCSLVNLESSNGFGYRFQDELNTKLLISKSIDASTNDDPINYIVLSSQSSTNEIPLIYRVNIINTRLLADTGENIVHLILNL